MQFLGRSEFRLHVHHDSTERLIFMSFSNQFSPTPSYPRKPPLTHRAAHSAARCAVRGNLRRALARADALEELRKNKFDAVARELRPPHSFLCVLYMQLFLHVNCIFFCNSQKACFLTCCLTCKLQAARQESHDRSVGAGREKNDSCCNVQRYEIPFATRRWKAGRT